jgi:hypothetical protein
LDPQEDADLFLPPQKKPSVFVKNILTTFLTVVSDSEISVASATLADATI